MKILVTGGSGFIGAWIIRRLIGRGHEVRVLDIKQDRRVLREIVGAAAEALEWQIGDVSAAAAVDRAVAGCDVVVHQAALLTPACRADPVRGAEVNLIGTLHVFAAARRHGLRGVVYMSSAGVFGPDDGTTPRPTTHYGAFKLAGEGCARAFWEEDGLRSIGFRPFIVYGPGREIGLTAGPTLACRAAARGEPYVIPFTGPSDLIHVDDVAAAYEAAVEATLTQTIPGAHVFNLIGEVATTEAVIATIRAMVPDAVLRAEGPVLPTAAHLARDDLARVLPDLPHTPLAEGLARTIAHYRTHP